MNILGLPGKNDATGPWMEKILSGVSSQNDVVVTQYYKAWQVPGSEIDEFLELKLAADFRPHLLVAKSMGSIIAILGASTGKLVPEKCVLIGVPVDSLREDEKSALSSWSAAGVNTLFIQQSADLTGSYQNLADVVSPSPNVTFVEIDGSDHVYGDTEQIAEIINDWQMRGNL